MKESIFNLWLTGCLSLCGLAAAAAQTEPGRLPGLPDRPSNPAPPAEPTVPNLPSLPSLPGGANKTAEQLVRVRSMADVNAVTPGLNFHLAFIFDIEPGWHIYWKNAGASGGPTTISVSGPADFKIESVLYPRPEAIESEEGTTYGYEKQVVLFVEVTAPSMLTNGHVTFNARVNWMVCKDVCLLGRTSQVMHVITAEGDGSKLLPPLHPIDPVISATRSRLPTPLDSITGATAAYADGTLTISVPAAGFSTAQFFPDQTPGVTYDSPAVSSEGESLVLTVPVTVRPNNSLGKPLRIAGTVGLGVHQTDPCYDFEIPLPAP